MKNYSMVSEGIGTQTALKFAGHGALVGGVAGGIASIAQKQQETVNRLIDKYEQTGNEKYKQQADRVKAMSPAKFRLLATSSSVLGGAAVGGAIGAGVGAGVGTTAKVMGADSKFVSNTTNGAIKHNLKHMGAGAAIGGGIGSLTSLSIRQDRMVKTLENEFEETGDTRYKRQADYIKTMTPKQFRFYMLSKLGAGGAIAGGLVGNAVS